MRYFTFEYWCSCQTKHPAPYPGPRYQKYLRSVRDQFPESLRSLADNEIGLHDARLENFALNVPAGTLTLHLILADDSALQCVYGGLLAFNSITSRQMLGSPAGYGDLGYDELHFHAPGDFEHRMLFSTGIELHIRFRTFRRFV